MLKLKNLKIGLGITGSFCNFSHVSDIINELKKEGAEVIPIISNIVKTESTRFYENREFLDMVKRESGNEIIDSIVKAEPIGPKNLVDIILICPCTGNTIAKLNIGITDSPVLMAVKGHIRNNKPVVIGISTNDGLGQNAKNIFELLNTKNFYFVPFKQDSYQKKPKSLVLDYTKIIDTVNLALKGKQLQPLFSI